MLLFCVVPNPKAWYDLDMKTYQEDRSTELEKVFEERQASGQTSIVHAPETFGGKVKESEVPEWTEKVKAKKSDEYYGKIKEVFLN